MSARQAERWQGSYRRILVTEGVSWSDLEGKDLAACRSPFDRATLALTASQWLGFYGGHPQ
jgi:hypothetical protein